MMLVIGADGTFLLQVRLVGSLILVVYLHDGGKPLGDVLMIISPIILLVSISSLCPLIYLFFKLISVLCLLDGILFS